jgi:hypothetical protein
MTYYFALSSILWAVLISWTLYLVVVDEDMTVETRLKRYIAYAYVIPFIISIPPLAMGRYGDDETWCSITSDNEGMLDTGLILRLV